MVCMYKTARFGGFFLSARAVLDILFKFASCNGIQFVLDLAWNKEKTYHLLEMCEINDFIQSIKSRKRLNI